MQVKSSDIDQIADCLNIEGGDPYRRLINHKDNHKDSHKKVIWANIILDLDRPLIDHVIFETIWNDNRFPLLEPRIDNLNEHHFMAAFLMIIQYYVSNCHKLLEKEDYNENVKITIHLHQDPSRIEILTIIKGYLAKIARPKYITFEYLTDTPIFNKTVTNYKDTDILISLSQCAGLSEKYLPGTLHIANTFLPFDGKTIFKSKEYTVENDLMTRLPDILASKYNELVVEYVNKTYKSYNPLKKDDKAYKFKDSDFIRSKVSQIDGLWNPIDGNELISLL